jgi:AcrR family transcriptional regulator
MTKESGDAQDWLAGGSRRDASRQRIITVATELLREHGFDNLDPDQVAARAGCSRATMYRYVGGKDAIREAVVLQLAISVVQQIQNEVSKFQGADRAVEVVLASVAACRAEPIVNDALKHAANYPVGRTLNSPEVLRLCLAVSGLDPTDTMSAHAMTRATWSLIQNPMEDIHVERQYVERFVKPGFVR